MFHACYGLCSIISPSLCHHYLIMAIVQSLQTFSELLSALETVPADEYHWLNVKLQCLSMRSNAHGTDTWVAISIGMIAIGGTCFALSENLEAHISLGTWTQAATWAKQFNKADKKLKGYSDGLDLQLRLNGEASNDRLLVFSFNVNSISGQRLHSMEQVLSAGGRVYGSHRGISPPGPVFHLSVRRS